MRLLFDENVPRSVADYLGSVATHAESVRDLALDGSPDALIAAIADRQGSVIVTYDKDFKALVQRQGIGRRRFRSLGRILLRVTGPRAVDRLKEVQPLLDFAYKESQRRGDKRFIAVIAEGFVRFDQ